MTLEKPFRAHVPDADLADLRRRLAATRWPDQTLYGIADSPVGLAAWQEPDLFVTEVRAAFRSLRMQNGGRHE